MNGERRLGVLGGTFDPIHNGHLRAGDAAAQQLRLNEIRVIPAHDPPHRPLDPKASAFHRFAMAALAIDGRDGWRLSDAELTRTGPSYSADTLRTLHAEGWEPLQIFFILGSDAFAEIATWYDYPAVLDAANFAVIARPGTTLQAAWERIDPRLADRSSAATRTAFHRLDVDTPDVSSTLIRARLSEGRPIEDLVPPPVARYIVNHRLYIDDPAGAGHFEESSPVNDLHGKREKASGPRPKA